MAVHMHYNSLHFLAILCKSAAWIFFTITLQFLTCWLAGLYAYKIWKLMQMSNLYASDLPFKNFIYSRYLTSFRSCYCKKQFDISFYVSVLLLKINCIITLSKFAVEPLWQCYDAIYHQLEDRHIKNWHQFVNFTRDPLWLIISYFCLELNAFVAYSVEVHFENNKTHSE